ncbi:hypothetical protein ACQPZJ_27015 [Actinoplanes sp. CA-054009]
MNRRSRFPPERAAGYCLAKASTRTAAEKALEELHRSGAVQRLRLAQHNAGAPPSRRPA